MPIYAYRCAECGHELEALQKISDAPLKDCPACGAAALQKQITAAAFRLKGAGWYETDFKKEGDKRKNLHGEGETSKDAGAKTETAKDKPAAEKTAKTETSTKPEPKSTTPATKPAPKAAAAS
jgi:putative FmdB family regulatory protein